MPRYHSFTCGLFAILALAASALSHSLSAAPLPEAELNRSTAVDFEKEILPILKNNCLACHNQTKPKAELVLETPQTILKGGDSGPAVVPGKPTESLLWKVAAHATDPFMPPKDNKVAASNLSPAELALLRLWIQQGATGEVRGSLPIEWHALPSHLNPIYAVALTADGQFTACGRANQIFVYHLPSGQLAQRLADPALKVNSVARDNAAHLDMVHSLAFNPDGTLLASGGYREVKLWRRPRNVALHTLTNAVDAAQPRLAASADGKWLALTAPGNRIRLIDSISSRELGQLDGHTNQIASLAFSPDNQHLAALTQSGSVLVWQIGNRGLFCRLESPEAKALCWVEPDQFATGGTDKTIRLWKLPAVSGTKPGAVKELNGPQAGISLLVEPARWTGSPIQTPRLLSASVDGAIQLWDLEKGESIRTFKAGTPVAALAFRPDQKRIASASGNIVTLWDAESGKSIAELKGDRYAQERAADAERTLAFSKSELAYHKGAVETAEKNEKTQSERVKKATETHATAEKNFAERDEALKAAIEARGAAEKLVTDLKAELKKVEDANKAAESAAALAATAAKAAIAKATDAKLAADQAGQTKADAERVAADSSAIAARTKAQAAQETGDAKAIAEKTFVEATAVATRNKEFAERIAAEATAKLKLSADATSAAEKAVEEVAAKSFASGQARAGHDRIAAEHPEKLKQATEKLTAATKAVDEGDKEFKKAELARSTATNELELSKAASQQAIDLLKTARSNQELAQTAEKQSEAALETERKAVTGQEKNVQALAFSPDNLTLITSGEDGVVRTWSAGDGRAFETFEGHTGAVFTAAFLTPSTAASAAADGRVKVWDLNPAWTLDRTIGTGGADSPLLDRVNAIRFSPDGLHLAIGSGEPTRGSAIHICEVSSGKWAHDFKNIHSDVVLSLDYSADGRHLASGGADRFVRVLDLTTGKLVRSFEGHTHHVLGVSWKRNGRTLASSGADNVIKVWDFLTGERKKNIEGFSKEVTSICFVSGTDFAVAASGDGQIKAVRENGENVRSFTGAEDYVYSVAATPDGKIVVAGGEDSVLRVWNGANGEKLATFNDAKSVTRN
jgi:WD40 repeat protein